MFIIQYILVFYERLLNFLSSILIITYCTLQLTIGILHTYILHNIILYTHNNPIYYIL